MPHNDHEIERKYYTMGEVTKMFNVNASQIRFYEKEFDFIQPKKKSNGKRLFRPEDIQNLKIIFSLVKDKGYTIKGAREIINSSKEDLKGTQKVIDTLLLIKSFLLEVRKSL